VPLITHPTTYSAEVKERVQLHLYTPSGPVIEQTLPSLTFYMVTGHGHLVSRFPVFVAIAQQFEMYQTLSINTIKQTATKKKLVSVQFTAVNRMTVDLFTLHSNSRQQTWVYLDVWDRELNVALLFMCIFAALTVNYSGYRHAAPYKSH